MGVVMFFLLTDFTLITLKHQGRAVPNTDYFRNSFSSFSFLEIRCSSNAKKRFTIIRNIKYLNVSGIIFIFLK